MEPTWARTLVRFARLAVTQRLPGCQGGLVVLYRCDEKTVRGQPQKAVCGVSAPGRDCLPSAAPAHPAAAAAPHQEVSLSSSQIHVCMHESTSIPLFGQVPSRPAPLSYLLVWCASSAGSDVNHPLIEPSPHPLPPSIVPSDGEGWKLSQAVPSRMLLHLHLPTWFMGPAARLWPIPAGRLGPLHLQCPDSPLPSLLVPSWRYAEHQGLFHASIFALPWLCV